MDLSVTEQLSYSTVRVECEDVRGTKSSGTGFFMSFKENRQDGLHIPVVITNKHVIEGAKKGTLIFTQANTQGEPVDSRQFSFYVDNFESFWRKHPDPEVDLCAMPLAPFQNAATQSGVKLFYVPLPMSLIPTQSQLDELSAVEDVIMVGYPNGIWDEANNKPIFRKGITATHPCKDYAGRTRIVIDMACFPGSSGSPVFILNEGGYRDKHGKLYIGRSRLLLLGVLHAGYQYTATGKIGIASIPTKEMPVAISQIPNHLGVIIKSSRIKELEELF